MKIERINVAELSLDPSNVRKHSRKNLDAIKASLRKFGQQKPIVVDAKGIVLAGNGTLTAAKELGWAEIEATRTVLQGVEATAFAIADNRSAELAEWDDKLSNVLKSLKDADFPLDATGFDEKEIDKLINEAKEDQTYTRKINLPIYEIKGEKPAIQSLFSNAKTDSLKKEIEKANLPKDVCDFLIRASERHTVFDFGKIAEYYAHAEPNIQRLMENSALVIIDFDKAIENGFVKLSDAISNLVETEEENA
jgi:ParB-like chromosome segregation protein Spo0J